MADETTTGQEDPRDYLAQVRQGGEFAVERVREAQSRADRAEARAKELETKVSSAPDMGSLRRYLDQGLTLEQIASHLDTYSGWLGNERVMEAVRAAQNGTALQAGEEDEYEDPTLKSLREKVANLESERPAMMEALVAQGVEKHMGKLFEEFPFDPDTRNKVLSHIDNVAKQWSQTAGGRESLRKLRGQEGFETIMALAIQAAGKDKVREAVLAAEQQKQAGVRRAATDGPSGFGTSGDEAPPEFKGVTAALDAFRWAGDKLGIPRQ